MSVMAETIQSVMGPYIAVAAARSSLTAWTAVCREVLVMKVAAGEEGGCGAEGDGGGAGGGGGGGGGGDGGEGQQAGSV